MDHQFSDQEHWGGNSKMKLIETGLEDLKRIVLEKKIRSIAIPARERQWCSQLG
jgi:hypothetical protein